MITNNGLIRGDNWALIGRRNLVSDIIWPKPLLTSPLSPPCGVNSQMRLGLKVLPGNWCLLSHLPHHACHPRGGESNLLQSISPQVRTGTILEIFSFRLNVNKPLYSISSEIGVAEVGGLPVPERAGSSLKEGPPTFAISHEFNFCRNLCAFERLSESFQ